MALEDILPSEDIDYRIYRDLYISTLAEKQVLQEQLDTEIANNLEFRNTFQSKVNHNLKIQQLSADLLNLVDMGNIENISVSALNVAAKQILEDITNV